MNNLIREVIVLNALFKHDNAFEHQILNSPLFLMPKHRFKLLRRLKQTQKDFVLNVFIRVLHSLKMLFKNSHCRVEWHTITLRYNSN